VVSSASNEYSRLRRINGTDTTDVAPRHEFSSRKTTKVIDGVSQSGWLRRQSIAGCLQFFRLGVDGCFRLPGHGAYRARALSPDAGGVCARRFVAGDRAARRLRRPRTIP
jgi:hypothetical protein